jgi:hypothetical protein
LEDNVRRYLTAIFRTMARSILGIVAAVNEATDVVQLGRNPGLGLADQLCTALFVVDCGGKAARALLAMGAPAASAMALFCCEGCGADSGGIVGACCLLKLLAFVIHV